MSDRFSATAGLRWAKVETNAEATPGWDPNFINGLDFSDDTFVGALNLIYRATDNLNVVGSVASGFRAPNIIERLFNGLTPRGRRVSDLPIPTLVSEDSDQLSTSASSTSDAQALFEVVLLPQRHRRRHHPVLPEPRRDRRAAARHPGPELDVRPASTSWCSNATMPIALTLRGGRAADRWLPSGTTTVTFGGNFTYLERQERIDSREPADRRHLRREDQSLRPLPSHARRPLLVGRGTAAVATTATKRRQPRSRRADPAGRSDDPSIGFTVHTLAGGFMLHDGAPLPRRTRSDPHPSTTSPTSSTPSSRTPGSSGRSLASTPF